MHHAYPVRGDSSHTNEHPSCHMVWTNKWVCPVKLDLFRVMTATATLQLHPFWTRWTGWPYFAVPKTRSLTEAVSKKPRQYIEYWITVWKRILKANFFSHLFTTYNIIYSQYSCLQLLLCIINCLFVVISMLIYNPNRDTKCLRGKILSAHAT